MFPLVILPTVKLPPAILPVAEIKPAVNMLPPVTLAATVSEVNVPNDVMLVCAAVATVPNRLPPVMLPVAEIAPAVNTLPPVMLPVALTLAAVTNVVALTLLPAMFPPVRLAVIFALLMSPVSTTLAPDITPKVMMLPPTTLPVADTAMVALTLLAVTLPVPPRALLTAKEFKVPTLVKLLVVTLELSVAPVNSAAEVVAVTPVSALPLPTKYAAVTLPALVIFPVADTWPAVVRFPPLALPVAIMALVAIKLPPVTLPVEETCPTVRRLPPCTLPVTLRLPKVPTVVKLLVVTLELRVEPVIKLAAGLDTTPVRADPLPTNLPLVTMLPVALIMPFPVNNPCRVAPVPDTTNTLAVPLLLIFTVLLVITWTFELPFWIPVTPPIPYSSVKLLLQISKASRKGVPVPSLAVLPVSMYC